MPPISGNKMSPIVERVLEKNPALDRVSVEAGVKAALREAAEVLDEHENKWYVSNDPSRSYRWLTLRDYANDLYQLSAVPQKMGV